MSDTFSAFFYGTLMHPSILRRVIGHVGARLEICPALLLGHTRHHVKHADYPGVVPYSQSRTLFSGDLAPEERTVRGTLVSGLALQDMVMLDYFEGNEYVRETVQVHPLEPFTSLSSASSSAVPASPPALPSLDTLAAPVSAELYLWARPVNELTPALWEYAAFVRDNAWKWVGSGSSGPNADYAEVDRRRAMNGDTARNEIESAEEGEGKKVVEVHEKGTAQA